MRKEAKAILAAAALCAAAALTAHRGHETMPTTASELVSSPRFTEEAKREAAAAEKLAAQSPATEDAALAKLTRKELEARIGEIDAQIERRRLVERSNRGELGESELGELRRLLGQRNQYFVRKIDLDLGNG